MPLEDLVLMAEVNARRALADRTLVLRVLAPVGPYGGRGVLRVLRARMLPGQSERIELICGYEAYDRLTV